MKRLTGRNYPVFFDNMESVDDLSNIRPTSQMILAKCVHSRGAFCAGWQHCNAEGGVTLLFRKGRAVWPIRSCAILEAARRCGLVLNDRTLHSEEVEASCPFCGDHGTGKYHLSLNTRTDQYRCNLCGASGNSVTLYARLNGLTNKEAYLELAAKSNMYKLPLQPSSPNTTSREPYALKQRHAAYSENAVTSDALRPAQRKPP
ncbi:MAG: hypothetical protein ACLU3I_08235 [Acutalibacteraceae bacterium]